MQAYYTSALRQPNECLYLQAERHHEVSYKWEINQHRHGKLCQNTDLWQKHIGIDHNKLWMLMVQFSK